MSESSKSKSLNLHSTPTLQCKDLHEYLKSRSSHFLETLYNYPTICLAVYRELPELARHFVIRLLFVEQPVPQAVVASWVSQTHAKEQIKASEALSELSVWNEAPIPGGLPGWFLSHSFKKNLKVWLFLQHYLHTAEKRNLSSAECLAFLYQLSFSTLGKRKAGRFYPTRLALNITCVRDEAGLAGLAGGGRGVGYIVVESNYRVYGYTQSALQVALLGLFPNLVVGVITRESVRQAFRGGISAEQIIKYLEQHSHPQMLNTDSAGVAACTSVLPPTVLDQVRLWESERNRFTYTEGVVYNQFLSQADFVVLRDYARQERVLSWQNERTRTMVVTKPGHDDVKRFWKRYSKSS
ncbi:unnamed protein product [Leptidea sinapis]|uniref:General transcription factor IIH subunit 4 n=1 Tax=Leptidea sinapis TaxID=189913 RepID=A0A5E4QI04_9NEOP|nr:unnamed protein product [Leptidea sinapis]